MTPPSELYNGDCVSGWAAAHPETLTIRARLPVLCGTDLYEGNVRHGTFRVPIPHHGAIHPVERDA